MSRILFSFFHLLRINCTGLSVLLLDGVWRSGVGGSDLSAAQRGGRVPPGQGGAGAAGHEGDGQLCPGQPHHLSLPHTR